MKLEISLFRFDKNSDYLPYYTKHFLKIADEKNLLDILKTLSLNSSLGYVNYLDFDLVVNGIYVKSAISVYDIVKNFGTDLTIEPMSIRMSYNDLLCEQTDFDEKIDILKEFTSIDNEAKYQSYKQYFYASNTLNHQKEYIGDSILLLAYELIQNNPSIENDILKKLSNEQINASYHTSLEKRIFNFDDSVETKIIDMQKKLGVYKKLEDINFKNKKTIDIDFGNFQDEYEIKHDFEDFNIAYFQNSKDEKISSFLSSLKANFLNLQSLSFDIARNSFGANKQITFDVVSTIMLDAFDNNADFLLVDNDIDFYIFDSYRKELLKACGRDVILSVVHINELQNLATDNHETVKESFKKHRINPEII